MEWVGGGRDKSVAMAEEQSKDNIIGSKKRQLVSQPYIPSLPDDIAVECLLRVSPHSHSLLHGVSRKWRELVSSPEYYSQRKREGTTGHFLCILQAAPDRSETQSHPVYFISVLNEQDDRKWNRLPPIPDFKDLGIPLFCRFAAGEGKLVIIGGWNPATWETLRSVYVFDFCTWSWHRGADMPTARSFFGCSAVGSHVFVAGGHDNTKTALPSAEVYNLDTDAWEALPNMAVLRDECIGATLNGKFYAISGYDSSVECNFVTSAEFWNEQERRWIMVENMCTVRPGTIVGVADRLVAFHDRQVLVYCEDRNRWELLDFLPEGETGISSLACATGLGKALAVTGPWNEDDEQYRTLIYTFPSSKRRKGKWEACPVAEDFVGVAQISCAVEL